MARIVPRSEAPGVDFCGTFGVDPKTMIIRSDLNCYMSVSDVRTGKNATLHPLHPSCCGGDHYFTSYSAGRRLYGLVGGIVETHFIIKGDQFREVRDLTTDENSRTGVLHEKCRGGDFYIGTGRSTSSAARLLSNQAAAAVSAFIIIFTDKRMLRVVSNLETGKIDPQLGLQDEYPLKEGMLGGLYYWSTGIRHTETKEIISTFYVVKPVDKWGLEYYCTDSLTQGSRRTASFHPSITNFLPGGLGITKGFTNGDWILIKSFMNSSSSTVEGMKYEVEVTIGHNRKNLSSIEHNWSVSASVSSEVSAGFTIESIFNAAVKYQFSLSVSYGGKSIQTTEEEWKEEVTTRETYDIGKFPPGRTVYIWQYKIGLGNTNILGSKHWAVTDTPAPPPTDPLLALHK